MEGSASETCRQFLFCQLCRTNYTQGEDHVYVKRHRETINKILAKFLLKVKEATASINKPIVKEICAEISSQLWCYYCECEVPRNTAESGLIILHSGTLDHLNSVQHFQKAKSFWWKNRIDCKLLDDYLIKDASYSRFRINVLKAIDEKMATKQQQVSHIVSVEEMRKKLLEEEESESNTVNSSGGAANGESWTTPKSCNKGNIFTGMMPPWLQKEGQPTTGKDIGPSFADYQKHLKVLSKSKLPANRVGAKFDRDSSEFSSWLPTFGRVWNNSRRSSSTQRFQPRGHKRPHLNQPCDESEVSIKHKHQPISGPAPNVNKYIL